MPDRGRDPISFCTAQEFAAVDETATREFAQTWHALLAPYVGQRLVGVVDAIDCVEIVFDGSKGNMLTLYLDEAGRILRHGDGFVADPDIYVAACGVDSRRDGTS